MHEVADIISCLCLSREAQRSPCLSSVSSDRAARTSPGNPLLDSSSVHVKSQRLKPESPFRSWVRIPILTCKKSCQDRNPDPLPAIPCGVEKPTSLL